MESSFEIRISGFIKPTEFVEKWSSIYSYGNEGKYENHIQTVLDEKESFLELFRWKNGTGNKIANNKRQTVERFWGKRHVLLRLKDDFSWELFEKEFTPSQSSNIWKLFLLHLVNPNYFPIFDQHVYRFYHFHQNGTVKEIPSNHSERYYTYKNDYLNWFNKTKESYELTPKKMDESFFSFGQLLKGLDTGPLQIVKIRNHS